MNQLINAARDYRDEGFGVLPLKQDKSPLLPSGHNYLYEVIEDNLIPRFFNRACKIGIPCGKVSGGFYCIDFDCHQGQDIKSIYKQFTHTPVVQTILKSYTLPIVRTPSGGYHIYFKTDDDIPGREVAYWHDGKTMIELRGRGQYVATIPSEGYSQIYGCEIIKTPTISEDEYDCLIATAEALTQYTTASSQQGSGTWAKRFDDTKPIGYYNEHLAEDMKSVLIDEGWTLYRTTRDQIEQWTRPGKDEGVSATFGRLHNMFYVFSSNAHPFQQNCAYTPYDVILKLKFHDDQKNALAYVKQLFPSELIVDATNKEKAYQKPPQAGFPVQVFHEYYQEIINDLNKSMNFSKDFLSVSMMFAIATLNGNKYKLKVKETWVSATTFWFAVVGEPGTMKSHPISTILAPIKKIDKQNYETYRQELQEWERNDKKARKPRYRQILISDATLEAIHDVHDHNKRGLGFYKDELVGFINDMNKYRKGSDEQFWLESFNNKDTTINRVTKDAMYLSDVMINIIGTIQPTILSDVVKSNKGSGMIDRFLYTTNETNIYSVTIDDASPQLLERWTQLCQHIDQQSHYADSADCGIVSMTPEAYKQWVAFDEYLCGLQRGSEMSQDMKNYVNKMKTYHPRFALLLTIMRGYVTGTLDSISGEDMDNSGEICKYFINSATAVFDKVKAKQEITGVLSGMHTQTTREKVVSLNIKGYKNVEIADELGISAQRVGTILKEVKEKIGKPQTQRTPSRQPSV